jgi:putative phage-type endonuclease
MPTEILTADQYLSEDWHQLRRNAISASEIAAVLGISPWATPFSLFYAKRDDWRTPVTEKMRMGHLLEPIVADLLCERLCQLGGGSELLANTGTWRSGAHDWALATPDRLRTSTYGGPVENVELKTTEGYDDWGPDESDEIPVYYRAQVQWQMYCTELQTTQVGVLFRGNHFRHYTVERDDADIELMVKKAEEFMGRLWNNTPPPIDDGQATLDTLKRLHPELTDETVMISNELAREWREVQDDLSEAKSRKRSVENRIRYLLGSGNRVVDSNGDPVLTRQVFDRKGYEVSPTTIDKLASA